MGTNRSPYLIKVKRVSSNARLNLPAYAGDAGLDLTSIESKIVFPLFPRIIKTGIQLELPSGTFAEIRTRSKHGIKSNLRVHPGIIDEGFRGEITVKVYNLGLVPYYVKRGEKIAQLIVHRRIPVTIKYVSRLSESSRGTKGFGSSDLEKRR